MTGSVLGTTKTPLELFGNCWKNKSGNRRNKAEWLAPGSRSSRVPCNNNRIVVAGKDRTSRKIAFDELCLLPELQYVAHYQTVDLNKSLINLIKSRPTCPWSMEWCVHHLPRWRPVSSYPRKALSVWTCRNKCQWRLWSSMTRWWRRTEWTATSVYPFCQPDDRTHNWQLKMLTARRPSWSAVIWIATWPQFAYIPPACFTWFHKTGFSYLAPSWPAG